MARDVQRHIRRCVDCRRRKSLHAVEGQEHLRLYQRPGEDVGVDLIGPFPETALFGYKYAITLYDFFNHYLVSIPIREKRPEAVARAIVTRYLMLRS